LKFLVLIATQDYEGCVQSRDLFKFWEISDNISETMQDET